jgi:hypothetical protein
MIYKLSKYHIILAVFLSLIISTLIIPPSTNAQTILFQDNFDDNYLNTNDWQIKNYNHARFGSYSDLGQLDLMETNQEIQIAGTDQVPDTYYPEYNKYYGWFGKSIISRQSFPLNKPITLTTKLTILNADMGHQSFLTIEFNVQNRIVLSIGNGKYANQLYWPEGSKIVVEENGINRCLSESNDENGISECNNLFNIQLNKPYVLEIRFDPVTKHVFGYLDGELVHAGTFRGEVSDFHVGIASSVRYEGNYIDARFDDFKLYSGSSGTILSVPDLKQFYPQWAALEYDFASSWYPSNPTIKRWGCALTSASMILKYYGHDINPDALNEWLAYQKDGYTRNGGIIWPAITRLTDLRHSGNRDWPILEFTYLNYSKDTLKSEIQNERPGILKLKKPIYDPYGNIKNYSTHFVAGKGYNDNDIFINDPGSSLYTTLSQANLYWGTPSQIGRFKKSNTDLSYIVLFVDDGFDIEVSDENGKIVGDEYYFKEYPMTDPDNPDLETGVETLNAFYYPKPESSNYTVRVKGGGVYRLDYYLYGERGSVIKGNSFASVSEDHPDEYVINFDKITLDDSSVPEISFESVISFWEEVYDQGYVEGNGIYTSINRLLKNALKMSGRNSDASESLLGEILYILDSPEGELENDDVISFLKYQVEYLISSLR